MACTEGVENGQYIRSYIHSLLSGKLRKVEDLAGRNVRYFSDCKSLYDHLHKKGATRVSSDKGLAIDLAALRQSLNSERPDGRYPLHWLPTFKQLADVLTKPISAESWWKAVESAVAMTLRTPVQYRREVAEAVSIPVFSSAGDRPQAHESSPYGKRREGPKLCGFRVVVFGWSVVLSFIVYH